MGSDTTLAVTPGSGTTLKVYAQTSGGSIQYVRELDGTAVTNGTWTLSTTAATSQIAADVTRVGITMVNNGNGIVYVRFDSTAPTATVNHFYLNPGDRWDVPDHSTTFAYSFLASSAGGTLSYALVTAA